MKSIDYAIKSSIYRQSYISYLNPDLKNASENIIASNLAGKAPTSLKQFLPHVVHIHLHLFLILVMDMQ